MARRGTIHALLRPISSLRFGAKNAPLATIREREKKTVYAIAQLTFTDPAAYPVRSPDAKRGHHREDITGFQVGLVEQKAEGAFQVRLMRFSLKLAQTNTQVLFIDFATFGVHMDSIGSTVTVSDAVLKEALPFELMSYKAHSDPDNSPKN